MSATSARTTRPGIRVLGRVVILVASCGLFLGGALLLTNELRDRTERTTPHRAGMPGEPPSSRVPIDDRMRPFLQPGIAWSRPRAMPYGVDTAHFSAGPSNDEPSVVFEAVFAAWHQAQEKASPLPPFTAEGLQEVVRRYAVHGRLHGVAYLTRMPPDVDAFVAGRLRFEPGGVLLAYPRGDSTWEYVTWFFPDGLDMTAFMRQFEPDTGVLDAVAPGMESHLEPTIVLRHEPGSLDPAAPGAAASIRAPRAVICVAKGKAGEAVTRAREALSAAGWNAIVDKPTPPGGRTCIFGRGPGEPGVWLTTPDREVERGRVTVMLGAP